MAHYVDNEKMLEALIAHKKARMLNKSARIPEYLGECILKIANNLSYKGNFINYTYREDMVLDGIENSILYINSFDPDRYSNPFAYFTLIIYRAFLRRILKEKKQSYIKSELVKNMPIDSFDLQDQDADEDFKNSYMAFIQTHQNFDSSFMKKKDKIERVCPLDEFFGVETETVNVG